jgi:dTDP-4-dehydrorhamnose reductase
MDILITGGTGYLGGFVIKALVDAKSEGRLDPSLQLHATWNRQALDVDTVDDEIVLHKIDLTDEFLVNSLVEEVRPQVVIHLAALAAVGACEKDRELAMRTNCPYCLVEAVQHYCGKSTLFLFASTDLVYDGEYPVYKPTPVRTIPGTAYGQSKLAFEMEVLRLRHGFCFRLSNMLGSSYCLQPIKGGKFLQWVVQCCAARSPVGLRHDERRSFVSVNDVAETFISVIVSQFNPSPVVGSPKSKSPSSKRGSIYNIGGPSGLSRLDVAKAVASRMSVSLIEHNDENVCNEAASKAAASGDTHEWHVYRQTNKESIESSGISNPRDVTMDSTNTESTFGVSYRDLKSIVNDVVPKGGSS